MGVSKGSPARCQGLPRSWQGQTRCRGGETAHSVSRKLHVQHLTDGAGTRAVVHTRRVWGPEGLRRVPSGGTPSTRSPLTQVLEALAGPQEQHHKSVSPPCHPGLAGGFSMVLWGWRGGWVCVPGLAPLIWCPPCPLRLQLRPCTTSCPQRRPSPAPCRTSALCEGYERATSPLTSGRVWRRPMTQFERC